MHNPLPPRSFMTVMDPVQFEGKKKKSKRAAKPMDPDSLKLERELLERGVNGESLWDNYKVRLWNIRQLKDKVLLKVDDSANRKLSVKKLVKYLQDQLNQPVIIKFKKLDDCCQKQCKGCLADRPEKQVFWKLNRKK